MRGTEKIRGVKNGGNKRERDRGAACGSNNSPEQYLECGSKKVENTQSPEWKNLSHAGLGIRENGCGMREITPCLQKGLKLELSGHKKVEAKLRVSDDGVSASIIWPGKSGGDGTARHTIRPDHLG